MKQLFVEHGYSSQTPVEASDVAKLQYHIHQFLHSENVSFSTASVGFSASYSLIVVALQPRKELIEAAVLKCLI